jgi:hypothetical protein
VFSIVKKQLKPEDLANWRRLSDGLNPGWMVSCATGADWSGPAQQLANIAGVPVKAPTNVLWLVRKGGQTLPIIHLCRYCASFLGKSKPPYFYDHIAASTRRGTWRTFQPQNDEADKKVRDLLLAAAERMPWWEVRVTEVGTVKNPATAADALIRLGSKTKKDELIAAITGKKKGWRLKGRPGPGHVETVDANRLGLKRGVDGWTRRGVLQGLRQGDRRSARLACPRRPRPPCSSASRSSWRRSSGLDRGGGRRDDSRVTQFKVPTLVVGRRGRSSSASRTRASSPGGRRVRPRRERAHSPWAQSAAGRLELRKPFDSSDGAAKGARYSTIRRTPAHESSAAGSTQGQSSATRRRPARHLVRQGLGPDRLNTASRSCRRAGLG